MRLLVTVESGYFGFGFPAALAVNTFFPINFIFVFLKFVFYYISSVRKGGIVSKYRVSKQQLLVCCLMKPDDQTLKNNI